jgi:hypothetical protein
MADNAPKFIPCTPPPHLADADLITAAQISRVLHPPHHPIHEAVALGMCGSRSRETGIIHIWARRS